jgi:poly-gamma-glutamate synthesis protein (capsule biosynthesis protein)
VEKSLRLAIAGDVMLGRLVADILPERGYAWPWGDLRPILRGVDLFLINLECALTHCTEQWRGDPHKPYFFRADPGAVQTLTAGRVDFASLANNHIGDFGTEGLVDTCAVLERAGIAHAGAGSDLATARAPAIFSARGHRVGIVAYADHPIAWAATEARPGLNYTPISTVARDFGVIASTIGVARAQSDLVIFSIHWGPNMRPRPTPRFRAFARRVIDAGADLFWGHSAHVVQGVEIWRGKPILYDTGDFVDDYAVDAELRNDLSGLFLLDVGPGGVERVEVLPTQIGDRQVNRAEGPARDWFVERFTSLCAELGTRVVVSPARETVGLRID